MNENSKKKRINRLQNTAIVLLSIMAASLFFYSFAPSIDAKWPDLSSLLSSHVQSISLWEDEDIAALSAPVKVAVTGQHGRFGCVASLTDENLIPLNTLMKEAFGSASAAVASSEEEFRNALGKNSIYYDLTTAIPMPLLSSMLDTSASAAPTLSVLRLLLTADTESVRLFCFDGNDYYMSSTAISPLTLENTVAAYEPNDTAFLFERDDFQQKPDPFTLITQDMFSRPGYTCSIPAAGGENSHLLEFLGFNSHSNSRYVESDGTEVIFASDATVRIETDGTVTYAGTRRSEPVFLADGTDSAAAVNAAYRIASELLSANAGDAALYLEALKETEHGYTVDFNYMADGVPVRFRDGSAAASVTVSDGTVTAFTLHCRCYTRSETSLRPLPLAQALAIASGKDGVLDISYVDNSTSALSVSWIVMQ